VRIYKEFDATDKSIEYLQWTVAEKDNEFWKAGRAENLL